MERLSSHDIHVDFDLGLNYPVVGLVFVRMAAQRRVGIPLVLSMLACASPRTPVHRAPPPEPPVPAPPTLAPARAAELPNVTNVEIVVVQPEAADLRAIEHLRATSNPSIEPVLYLVKIYLEKQPPVTGSGYTLYVGKELVRSYAGFRRGIYFNVHDRAILDRHRGEPIRFCTDLQECVDSTATLPAISSERANLPTKRAALQTP